MKKQRVTLYIEPKLWKMIRMFSVSRGQSASQLIEDTMYLRLMDTDIPERLESIDSGIDSSDKNQDKK